MPPRKAFLLRLDPSLLNALQHWADAELRSLNAQIEFVLRRAVQESLRGQKDSRPATTDER